MLIIMKIGTQNINIGKFQNFLQTCSVLGSQLFLKSCIEASLVSAPNFSSLWPFSSGNPEAAADASKSL